MRLILKKWIALALILSFSFSLFLPAEVAMAIDREKQEKTGTKEMKQSPSFEKKAKMADFAKEVNLGVPFVVNEGQKKDQNIAYYTDIPMGTVAVTHDGKITYDLVRYEEVSEEEYQAKKGTDNAYFQRELTSEEKMEHKDYHADQFKYEVKKESKIEEILLGANISSAVTGADQAVTKVNCFDGKNQQDWKTNLSTYNKVKMGEIYPGIELTLKATGSNVEKVFTVNPGGNPEIIQIDVGGAASLAIDEKGQLTVNTNEIPVTFTAPIAYQEINGETINVPVAYRVQGTTYGFAPGEYDQTQPLIIDPLLAPTVYDFPYLNYLSDIEFDNQGNVYTTRVQHEIYINKYNADLTKLLVSTSIQGDWIRNSILEIGENDNVYLAGSACELQFPSTSGAVPSGNYDGFVMKINSSLDNLLATTYIGGSSVDYLTEIQVDALGNVYIAGTTISSDFPTTQGAYNRNLVGEEDIFIAKLNADFTNLESSTLFGSITDDSISNLSLDKQGNIYISGGVFFKGNIVGIPSTDGAYQQTWSFKSDDVYCGGFISKFDSNLGILKASTLVNDYVSDIALDTDGNIIAAVYPFVLQKYDPTLTDLLIFKGLETPYYIEDNSSWGRRPSPEDFSTIYTLLTDQNGKFYAFGSDGVVEVDSDLNIGESYGFTGDGICDNRRYGFNRVEKIAINKQGALYFWGAIYNAQENRNIFFFSRFSFGQEDSLEYSLGNPSWGGVVGQNINICTGNFFLQETDLSIPTRSFPLSFTRTYNSRSSYMGPMGKGWQHCYNIFLLKSPDNSVTVVYEDGHKANFKPMRISSEGTPIYYSFPACRDKLTVNTDGTYTLILANYAKKYIFTAAGKLLSIFDRNENQTTLQYTGELLATVTEPTGRTLQLFYNNDNRIIKGLDSTGRFFEFAYDDAGNLTTVKNLNGEITTYDYDLLGLTSITDSKKRTVLINMYDNEGRVIQQKDGKNDIINITYNPVISQNIYTDSLNNTSSYTYDLDYRLRKIQYSPNEISVFEYDWYNNLISESDFNGIVTEYAYDEKGNLKTRAIKGQPSYENWRYTHLFLEKISHIPDFYYDVNRNYTKFLCDYNGNITNTRKVVNGQDVFRYYTYNAHGQIIELLDTHYLRKTYFAYDENGNLQTVTDPENKTTTYTYDAAGRIKNVKDSNNGIWSYTYDNMGNLLTVIDPKSNSTTYSYDFCGNLSSITDQRGKTTTYQYDENGNLIQVTDPLLNTTTFTYDGNGNCRTITNAKGQTTTYHYDHRDRLVSIVDHAGNTESYTLDGNGNVLTRTDARNNTVEYEYDYANRLVKVTDPLGNSFSNSYDPSGNKIAETDPFGNETEYIYDEASQLVKVIDPRDNTSIINTYDRAGQLLTTTDAENNITTYSYDGCGRIKTVVDALNNETVYTYDDNGNLSNVLDANNQNRTMQYDALNREIAEINDNGASITKDYDAAGNLISLTTLKGDTINYEYDDMNRLTKKKYPDDTTVTYAYNELGQRTSMIDPAGTTTYTYDNLNRLQTVTRNGTTITYDYDEANNITDIIYPNNQHLIYAYNELNLPVTVSDGTKTHSVIYDIAAQPDQGTMPNGVVADYEFDEYGRLTLLENKLNGSIIAKSAYNYDNNGNRVSYTNKDGQIITYAYDALNQLKEVQGSKLSEYIFDPVGNRDNVSETVNEEKLKAGIYDYDFDYEDRLIKTEKQNETISYTYDGDGTLVKKAVTNGTESMTYEYFYDYTAGLPRLFVEKRSDGTNYNYLYFGGKLYGRTGTGGTVYYHHDGLGSVIAITDENGNILNEYAYEAFGEPIIIKETVENSIMFTGEPYDQSGFVYLRARYYDPTAGRFVSSDKYKGEIENPVSQNSYAYCGNNPVNYVDPSGYHPLVIAAIAIAGYLGTTAVETAPDVAIDYALDGEDFDLGSSFGSNFAMNLIPGIGELNKARKGAMLGKVAVKNLPSALGKRVKKQTTNKIGNALKIPEHINNAGKFVNWAKQFQKSKEPLSIGQVKDLIAKAKELGVKVEATAADLAGHIGKAGENWGIPHIHIGNARIHIPVPKGFKL